MSKIAKYLLVVVLSIQLSCSTKSYYEDIDVGDNFYLIGERGFRIVAYECKGYLPVIDIPVYQYYQDSRFLYVITKRYKTDILTEEFWVINKTDVSCENIHDKNITKGPYTEVEFYQMSGFDQNMWIDKDW